MAFWCIILTFFLYLGCAVDFYFKKQYGMSIMYFCYAFANVGAYLAALQI